MAQINLARREVNCKIVYYGPGLSGKTTNLEKVFEKLPAEHKGQMTSIATEGDRTLFFDFLPIDIGTVSGMTTKFQIYTVPGQSYYKSTRALVLQGADGVIFVADSGPDMVDENRQSMADLKSNLIAQGLKLSELPFVIQYNKRDLPDVLDIAVMQEQLNDLNAPYIEASAVSGKGVLPTLKAMSRMVLDKLNTDSSRPASTRVKPAAPKQTTASAPTRPTPAARPAAKPAVKPAPSTRPAPAARRPAAPAGRPIRSQPLRPAAAPRPTRASAVSRPISGHAQPASSTDGGVPAWLIAGAVGAAIVAAWLLL